MVGKGNKVDFDSHKLELPKPKGWGPAVRQKEQPLQRPCGRREWDEHKILKGYCGWNAESTEEAAEVGTGQAQTEPSTRLLRSCD